MTPRLASTVSAAALLGLVGLLAVAHAAPAHRAARAGAAKPAKGDTSRVLIRIGGEPITRAMVQARIDELPEQYRQTYATPDGRKQLLDRMVEEKVWLMTALKNGIAERPSVQTELEQQRRNLLIRTYLNEVMAKNPAPSDSEATAYYDAHQADFRQPASITVRHIQLKTEAEARRVLGLARAKGADWNKLCASYSRDSLTRKTGGGLGSITKDGVFSGLGSQPAMAETAFASTQDRIGGPCKSDRGWHVIRTEQYKAESTRPFDQVRSFILRQLSQTRQGEFYQARLAEARQKLGAKPDSAAIKGFLSQRKTAREMFNEAQASGSAQNRITAYRQLLATYPDSDVSAQAQFMIGFIYSEELKNFDEADAAFKALLKRYPKSELAASAQWMVDHMRTQDAPAFMNLEADSSAQSAGSPDATKRPTGKP